MPCSWGFQANHIKNAVSSSLPSNADITLQTPSFQNDENPTILVDAFSLHFAHAVLWFTGKFTFIYGSLVWLSTCLAQITIVIYTNLSAIVLNCLTCLACAGSCYEASRPYGSTLPADTLIITPTSRFHNQLIKIHPFMPYAPITPNFRRVRQGFTRSGCTWICLLQ